MLTNDLEVVRAVQLLSIAGRLNLLQAEADVFTLIGIGNGAYRGGISVDCEILDGDTFGTVIGFPQHLHIFLESRRCVGHVSFGNGTNITVGNAVFGV